MWEPPELLFWSRPKILKLFRNKKVKENKAKGALIIFSPISLKSKFLRHCPSECFSMHLLRLRAFFYITTKLLSPLRKFIQSYKTVFTSKKVYPVSIAYLFRNQIFPIDPQVFCFNLNQKSIKFHALYLVVLSLYPFFFFFILFNIGYRHRHFFPNYVVGFSPEFRPVSSRKSHILDFWLFPRGVYSVFHYPCLPVKWKLSLKLE